MAVGRDEERKPLLCYFFVCSLCIEHIVFFGSVSLSSRNGDWFAIVLSRIPFLWMKEKLTSTPSVCFIVIGIAVARSSFWVKGKINVFSH